VTSALSAVQSDEIMAALLRVEYISGSFLIETSQKIFVEERQKGHKATHP
jgi:hypothetical protein